jgi:hypothetical protein
MGGKMPQTAGTLYVMQLKMIKRIEPVPTLG